MRVVSDQSWSRRGLSLFWGAEALSRIAQPHQVVSRPAVVRALARLAGGSPGGGRQCRGGSWRGWMPGRAKPGGRRAVAGGGLSADHRRFPGPLRESGRPDPVDTGWPEADRDAARH